jgi:hypothetical protein
MLICENCENEHDGSYGSGRFCSCKCARGFSTKAKRLQINKKISEKLKKYFSNKNGDITQRQSADLLSRESIYRNYLSPRKIKHCKFCNEILSKPNKTMCNDCKPYQQNIILFKKLNVYIEKEKLSKINIKALDILKEEYFIKKLSKCQIINKYDLRTNTIYDFFKKNNIKLRTLSEATNNAILENRYVINGNPKNYKSGKHISWENKIINYRSSYEYEYCLYLDENKISYDYEIFKIKYFDTQKNKFRIAIPDFYIPAENLIIEIKSYYTLNLKNMIDKMKQYKKLNYNIKLLIDKEDKTNLII